MIISDFSLNVPLLGIIDTKQELNRLVNKKNNHINELSKLDEKLNNTQFIKKAPKHIIEQFKKQSIHIKSSIEKIEQIIDTIS